MNNQLEKPDTSQKYVTTGFDGHPTIVVGDGAGLTRDAELIIHAEYYPNWPEEKWPVDPETGEKLPKDNPRNRAEKASIHAEQSAEYCQKYIDNHVRGKLESHAMDAQRYYAYHGHLNHEPEGLGAVFWGIIILIVVSLIIIGIFYF